MKYFRLTKIAALVLLLTLCMNGLGAENDKILWQIGKEDNNTAEFALGPDRSNSYSGTFPHDVLFVAGQSDAKKDWPYIQPGPADSWAGSKSHTFTIMFGLKNAPLALWIHTVPSLPKCKSKSMINPLYANCPEERVTPQPLVRLKRAVNIGWLLNFRLVRLKQALMRLISNH